MHRPALSAVMIGVAIVTLDISLTSTAVPALAQALGTAPATTLWILNAYYLIVVSALLPFAAAGEIWGHGRVFLIGLGAFALGALASGAADSLATLIAGRAVVGLGSAAVAATTPALVRTLYPPERIARGLANYAMIVGIALTVGPTAGSVLLTTMSWPWLFWSTSSAAIVAVAMAAGRLPEAPRDARRFDAIAAALCAAMFASLLFGIAGFARFGWQASAPAALCSAVAGWLLAKRERGLAAPILALDLLKRPMFALSAATSACAFTVQGIVLVTLPLFLVGLGRGEAEVGYLVTPWAMTLVLMTFVAAPLAARVPAGALASIGLVIVALGLWTIPSLGDNPTFMDTAWRLSLCGIGFGLFQSPNMAALMQSAPVARSGAAGGVLAISRLIGQATGAATVAYCLARGGVQSGTQLALNLGIVVALLGSAVSLARIHRSVVSP